MPDFYLLDLRVFLAANIYNLFLAIVFLARTRSLKQVEMGAGLVTVLMGIPLATASLGNAIGHREFWFVFLPLPLTLHCAIELFLDYIWKLDFRSTRWLWPYLALYYIGQWFLVGYAFMVRDTYGFITLVTYFLCLAATAYSYARVRHG